MVTWMVTGAGGFLGSNTAAYLGPHARLIGLNRNSISLPGFDEVHSVDLLDLNAVLAVVARTRPDVILNTAALASHDACERDPELAHAVNATAAHNIALASASVGAKLIHISTDAVFDGNGGPYSEEDAPEPFSAYGVSKLKGEEAVLSICRDAIIVRTNFFGWSPSGQRSILEFFVSSLRNQTMVNGYTDFVVSSIYVQHLIELIWQVAATENRGVIHIAAREGRSKYQFGLNVADAFGLPNSLILPVESAADDHVTTRNRDLSLTTDRIASWLKRTIPSQEEGIAQACLDESRLVWFLRGLG
jgi:dTDP-4-dehydrorhamnose reductase